MHINRHAPAVRALLKRRWTTSCALSATMIIIYFSFMGILAFDKSLLAVILAPGISVALLVGPLIIVSSVVLCVFYVVWANRVFDPAVRALNG